MRRTTSSLRIWEIENRSYIIKKEVSQDTASLRRSDLLGVVKVRGELLASLEQFLAGLGISKDAGDYCADCE
jgi:hypothetical protein